MSRALLLVDVQNGFMEKDETIAGTGELPVAGAKDIVPVCNDLIASGKYGHIAASLDWHPADHGSFASQHGAEPYSMGELSGQPQVMWPDHCVQDTPGAEFHPELNTAAINYTVKKGMDKAVDSYSAFQDNHGFNDSGLAAHLKAQGITELDVCGLASDVCVAYSAIDAAKMLPGVKIRFIEDASRGVTPEGVEKAKEDMRAAGIEIVSSKDILGAPGTDVSGDLSAGKGKDQGRI